VVDSDGHHPDDLLTPLLAWKVARGAGLDEATARRVLDQNPMKLLLKLSGGARL